jgi:ABC-type multidrug transport system fused ATPase/permease subunit
MTGVRITSAIRQDYFTALFSQSVHVLDSMPPGYATTIITTTGNTLQLGISEKLGVFVEYNATMIASIIVAFIYSWQLSLVTFTAVVFITFSVSLVLPYITKGQTNQTKVCTDSSILQDVADARVSPKLWRCL